MQKKIVRFKIFLVDFADVRAPGGYTQDFVRRMIFTSTPPKETPDSHKDPLEASIYQYFFASSDSYLRIAGAVQDWVNSNLNSRDIPHWNRNTMTHPRRANPPDAKVDWGASWPIVVAETLRAGGFTTANFPSASDLRDAVMRLPDGRTADKLVFLHTDVSGGGVKRGFSSLRSLLQEMSRKNVNNRTLPNSTRAWSSLWDSAWSGLPGFLVTPVVTANQTGPRADGTYAAPAPGATDLRMEAFSILVHEFGHLAVGLPDLYGETYGPWGNMCVMGGPYSSTHTTMPVGSYARERLGWLSWTWRSRANHRLHLRPYETHNEAVRLTNGAPGSDQYLVLSNRADRAYQRFAAPTDNGRGLLAYRLDEHGRTRMRGRKARTVRKVTSLVRNARGGNNASVLWKQGETIGAGPAAIFNGPATLRNGRGELWFTLKNVANDSGDITADLELEALHLLGDYHRATWHGIAPGETPIELAHDQFAGPDGHVILQRERMPVAGTEGWGLYLHPRWHNEGRIRGRYPIGAMAAGPKVLYAKLGMADEATGSNGARMIFRSGSERHHINLRPGDFREICVEFVKPGSQFEVEVQARGSARRDWVYIIDGWLVPAAPRIFDFIAEAGSATWSSGRGAINMGAGGSNGEVSARSWQRLHTGVIHFGQTLFTHPDWSANGFVQGEWTDLSVPEAGAFIRGLLGWDHGRSVTNNGIEVTVRWRVNGTANWTDLIKDAQFDYGGTSGPRVNRDLMSLELALPAAAQKRDIDIQVRVEADGSSGQDWVRWLQLAMTSA